MNRRAGEKQEMLGDGVTNALTRLNGGAMRKAEAVKFPSTPLSLHVSCDI